jgi:rod shape determining protein RodA
MARAVDSFAGSEGGRPALPAFSTVSWTLLAVTLLLAVAGLATVHSASAEMPVDYLPRQAIWLGLGLVALALALAFDYHLFVDFAAPAYGFSLLLLVATLAFGTGPGGTRSWLVVGGWTIGQPAELAKLALALALTRYLAGVDGRFLSPRQLAAAGAIAALPMTLIVVQPDLGSAAMLVPLAGGMVLVAGLRLRYLVSATLLVAVVGAGVWTFAMEPYQRQRVVTFLAPGTDPLGAGYQVRQSKIAVGSGQLTGRGYMQGTQSQLRFLPARHTDFVFAVLAEEWGFLGAAAALFLYGLWIVNALRIAMRARDREGILLVTGLTSLFAFHVLYNTAMVVGLVPITGIPLPFLSYGGSFTLMNFAATGLILSVDLRRYVNR